MYRYKYKFNHRNVKTVDEYGDSNYKKGATLSKQFVFDAFRGKFGTNGDVLEEETLKPNHSFTL